jgi:uncharacterized membrane protein
MVEDRIAALEARTATLEDRLRHLEWQGEPGAAWPSAPARSGPAWPSAPARSGAAWPPAPAPRAPEVRPSPPAAPPRAARPARDLEDIVGGSVLAWLGGVAVLAGLAFLLTIAISRGWLGEGARTVLAGALSLGLLGAGAWLREQRGRTEAALAAAAVGIAGGFGTLVVAGPVYDLVPQWLALAGAFAAGALGTALGVRWNAQVMGWLGMLGTLLAPAALGALDGAGVVFLALAYAATATVLAWQRWRWLAVLAFGVTTLQWLWWLAIELPADPVAALTLVAFGALTTALALGLEANRSGLRPVVIGPEARPAPHLVAALLLVIDAAVLAAAGWELLDGELWLAVLAAAHVALGLAAIRVRRISRELALLLLAIGIVLADFAFASMASGLPLVLGWAASTIPFAALLGAHRRPSSPLARFFDRVLGPPSDADRVLAIAGLLGQMVLAAGHTLLFDARPEALAGAAVPASMLVATGALAVVAWACGRLAGPVWRTGLDGLALAAVAHLTGLALEGAALSAVLAAEALALAELARRRDDAVAAWGAIAFAGAGLLHALAVLAPPTALIDGLDQPLAAAAALGAAAAALAAATRAPVGAEARRVLGAGAAITLLYLASVEVVTAGGPDLTGQTLLSVLWAVAGVGALLAGLLVDDRALRRGALILIAVTATKVFLYDLAELDSLYRVGSFIGFGLLLLCGAFGYQKVRPQS